MGGIGELEGSGQPSGLVELDVDIFIFAREPMEIIGRLAGLVRAQRYRTGEADEHVILAHLQRLLDKLDAKLRQRWCETPQLSRSPSLVGIDDKLCIGPCGTDRGHPLDIALATQFELELTHIRSRLHRRRHRSGLIKADSEIGVDGPDPDNRPERGAGDAAPVRAHVVLRGVDATGRDLVIAGDYIGHGMRQRAGELATSWLGPRTEREIAASVERDIVADRWTSLDHRLTRLAPDGALTADELDAPMRGRLQHLERLGLARPEASGWRLLGDMPDRLRALGERGDIVRTLQRALGADRRDLATEPAAETPVVGRIIAKGLRDELSDAGWIAIDGIDGRAHYRPLPRRSALADWPVGAIVEHRPATPTLDKAIQAAARDGFVTIEDGGPLDNRHRRRLEALRGEGITERLSHREWRVPDDLIDRGRRHDLARGGHLELRSPVGLDVQVRAVGATWLDNHIAEPPTGTAPTGFGAELLRARDARLGSRLAHRARGFR